MLSSKPSIGFTLLFQSGLLQLIFPQMAALQGAENVDGLGHKDNFYHTLQVIDNVAAKSDDLMAALGCADARHWKARYQRI